MATNYGGGKTCSACEKNLYAAEEFSFDDRLYHKACFKCSTCGHHLTTVTVQEHAGALYCKTCYSAAAGTGANYGHGTSAVGVAGRLEDRDHTTHELLKQGEDHLQLTPKEANEWRKEISAKLKAGDALPVSPGRTGRHKHRKPKCVKCNEEIDPTERLDAALAMYCGKCVTKQQAAAATFTGDNN